MYDIWDELVEEAWQESDRIRAERGLPPLQVKERRKKKRGNMNQHEGNTERVQQEEESSFYTTEDQQEQQVEQQKKPAFPFHCPECGEGFEESRWLGAHRYRAHGVSGSSRSATHKPTAEQRAKYAETARQKYKKKKKEEERLALGRIDDEFDEPISKKNTQEDAHDESAKHARARHLAYAFGHCEAWAKIYAESVGISGTEFTQELGELFRAQSRRKVLGA